MKYTILVFLLASVAHAKNVSTSGGRFQLIQLSDMRRDQFLLDTQTGKLWVRSCEVAGTGGNECDMTVWVPEHVEGITITSTEVSKRINLLKGDEKQPFDPDKYIKEKAAAQSK